jgi:transcriptional regulator with XRE-family HTH domain
VFHVKPDAPVKVFSGELVKKARIASGFSRFRLALQLNCSSMTIYNWEVGKAWPDAKQLPWLADELGVKIEDFFEDLDAKG